MYRLSKLSFIILLALGQFVAAQNIEDFKKIEVSQYSFKPNKEFKLLTIPASFGSSQLTNSSLLDSLKDKKVASVRLVYTKYRESESFDQLQLNKKRIANLVAQNPLAFSDVGIKWYCVEQTLDDSIRAKSLFHGFYILYLNKPPQRDYAISDKLLNQNVIATQTFKIRNHKDTTITGKEGSQVTIPSNCFLDENKKPYKGEVKMEVKEAITMESIILGNLVTMADGNALESGGMIYIDAKTKDGKTLTLNPNKPLEVSIVAKELKPDMKLWEAENNGKFINWKNPKNLGLEETLVSENSSIPDIKPMPKSEYLSEFDRKDSLAFHSLHNYQNDTAYLSHMRTFSMNTDKVYINYILYTGDKLKIALYKFNDGKKWKCIRDTTISARPFRNNNKPIRLPKFAQKYESFKVYLGNNTFDTEPFSKAFVNWYQFNLSSMGSWVNIDRLASDSRTKAVDFTTSLHEQENYTDISMYLVFKDKKILLYGFKSKIKNGYGFSHGDFEIPKLPVGAKATVLCIAYKKDTPYYALQNIVISEKQEVILKPVASSDDAIKKLIADSF